MTWQDSNLFSGRFRALGKALCPVDGARATRVVDGPGRLPLRSVIAEPEHVRRESPRASGRFTSSVSLDEALSPAWVPEGPRELALGLRVGGASALGHHHHGGL